jgi:transglutaminase-like putative cysteine protease
MLWLLGPLLLVLAPHAARLPWWISISWLSFASATLAGVYRNRPLVGGLLKIVLALAGTVAVFVEYGTLLGPRGGIALLAYLSGAKLLETRTPRDRMGLLFVGCFLLVANFLDAQSLLTAGYMVFALLALLAGLIAIQWRTPDWRPIVTYAARLMAQALPLALLIFLLFPRLQGPIWGLPQQTSAGSGLSDQMRPGDISQLILSDELAFRAEFPNGAPQTRQLYWRGPVLWDYDGRAWRTRPALRGTLVDAEGQGEAVHYTLTLEPQRQPWLPLLGLPRLLPVLPGAHLGPDLQWQLQQPNDQRLRYEVEAYLDYRLEPELPAFSRARALALPDEIDPRARELADGWRRSAIGPEAIVDTALRYFREQPFFYTLNPPRLGAEAVDEFLFDTRRGFCEHYAGAFVFLMRAAGVPARVVTGYQGGESNPYSDYWIVRGRDAHAWAEVWLAGRGWVRFDPTAAVAPTRVEKGLDAALPAGERRGGRINLSGAWLMPLRLGWDLINNQWNQWVLGYDGERQKRFLERLNPMLASWQGMVWALAVGGSILVLLAAFALLPRLARGRMDPVRRDYERYRRALARVGIVSGQAEAPEDLAHRAQALNPSLGVQAKHITRLYLAARYGPDGADAAAELARVVREFRPRRQSAATLEPPFFH